MRYKKIIATQTVKFITYNISNTWHLILIGLTVILCLKLLSLYDPQLIKQSINLLAYGNADSEQLFQLTLAMVALGLGVAVLRAIGRPLMLAFGRIVGRDLRVNLLTYISELSPKDYALPSGR